MSKFVRHGLRRMFRPELPKVSPVGAANAEGLKNKGGFPGGRAGIPVFGLPTRSGYDPALANELETPALSVGMLVGEPFTVLPQGLQPSL